MTVEFVASPAQGYIEALHCGLADAFVRVTAFASQAGLDLVWFYGHPAVRV